MKLSHKSSKECKKVVILVIKYLEDKLSESLLPLAATAAARAAALALPK
jgi:hypothetical protein